MENAVYEVYNEDEKATEAVVDTTTDTEDEGLSVGAKAGIVGGAVAVGVGVALAVRAGIKKVKQTKEYARLYREEHPELQQDEPKMKVKLRDRLKKIQKDPAPKGVDENKVVDVHFTEVEDEEKTEE